MNPATTGGRHRCGLERPGVSPTIYVLDAKGLIRFTGLRDNELEEAVNQLLKLEANEP